MGIEFSQALGGASTRKMAEHYAQLTEETAIAAAAAALSIASDLAGSQARDATSHNILEFCARVPARRPELGPGSPS